MSFEHRLFDDVGFGAAEGPEVIPVVSILLERLQLEDADPASQVEGIREWLRLNVATPSLLRSIERKGYSAALTDTDELIESNMMLVSLAVKEMLRLHPTPAQADELTSAGLVALVSAARSFDPRAAEVPFERYALSRIRGALLDEYRAAEWVSRRVRGGGAEAGRGRSLAAAVAMISGHAVEDGVDDDASRAGA